MNPSMALNHLNLAIVETDCSGKVLQVNHVLEEITGFTPSEVLEHDLWMLDVLNAEQNILSLLQETINNGHGWVGRLICRRKKKSAFQVEVAIVPLLRKPAEVTGLMWIIRDLDCIKDVESQLIQAQKMEAIGTLAGGIAHDFNNVLSIVSGFTSLALRNIEDEQSRRCLFNVLEASDRATDLVKQILSFTRKESQLHMPISLRPLIKGFVKLLKGVLPSNIDIQIHMGQSSFQVFGNPTQIHQILMNLSTNASHAMRGRGGVLKMQLDYVHIDDQHSSQISAGEYVQLIISDTGCGMSPEISKRIFEPFYTTKKHDEGTGLGLSVVSEIISKHSGSITVESTIGEGTEFQILLPLFKSEVERRLDQFATPSPSTPEKATVLMLDDEQVLVEVISEGLKLYGFTVKAFTDSPEAFDAFVQDPDSVDLILTDLMMPKLTGIEFAKKVLAIRKDIPIVLCTGFMEKDEEVIALDAGIKSVLKKPILIESLVKEISHQLWQAKKES